MTKKSIFLRGLAMGVCDIIPGVSGGTIAFVTGIYFRLLGVLNAVGPLTLKLLFRGEFKQLWQHLDGSFLAPLILGIGTAILAMARVIHYLLETFPFYTFSFFYGLILASGYLVYQQIEQKRPIYSLWLLLGFGVGYLLVELTPMQATLDPLFLFVSGFIAITAMILPGISGAFLLLILGQYHTVTGMLRNPLDLHSLYYLGIFAVGCLSGLLLTGRLLHYLMERFPSPVSFFLVGLMVGSIRKLWPFFEVEIDSAQGMFCLFYIIIGFGLVGAITYLANKRRYDTNSIPSNARP